MTDELASQPGTLATRPDEQEEHAPTVEPAVAPLDFRLNLKSRLAEPSEPLTTREHPLIRKLKWEHVVSDLPQEPSPIGATPVPLPPPPPVPPPPITSAPFEPPVSTPPAGTPSATIVETPTPDPVPAPTPAPAPAAVVTPPVAAAPAAPAVETPQPVAAPAVAEPEVAEEPVVEVAEVEMVADEVAADAAPPAPTPRSVEVNRLSSVPDLILDDSPVELPPITPSGGPIAAQPAPVFAPVLPETMFVAAARPITANVAALIAETAPSSNNKARRKRKRHPFRTFFTFLILLGMLGGGAYYARKYLLEKKNHPTWSAELEPFATAVAATRGLEFKASVEVQPITPEAYATRLATFVLPDRPGRAEAWRALGLLNGELDIAAIGHQAANDLPAFYDPTTKTIYVSNDATVYEHLYRFALRRALATALLDQHFDWSTRLTTATPAAALGLRATIDGDALNVANTLAGSDAPDQLAPELLAFVQAHGGAVSPSQYATTIIGRAGVAMRPTFAALAGVPDAVSQLEQTTPVSDSVLDAARLPDVAGAVAPSDAQGMIFWYYVLASRIDDTQAWSAIAHWAGDSLSQSATDQVQCVDAKVTAGDADGAAAMLAAFQSWAAAAPAESTTTVAAIDANVVAIRACDPGALIAAAQPAKVPVAFGGAGVERALVQAAINAAAQIKVDGSCVITAARLRGTPLTSPADDAPVFAIDWQPAYVAANLDVAAGCVATAG